MPTETDRLKKGLRAVSTAVAAFAEATVDYRRLLQTVAHQVADVVQDTCLMLLLEPNGGLSAAAVYDPDPAIVQLLTGAFTAPLGSEATFSHAALGGRRAILDATYDIERMRGRLPDSIYQAFRQLGVRGALVAPMICQSEAFGVLSVIRHRPERRPLDELDLELAQDLAGHAALAISNARLVARLRDHEELREAKELAVQANRVLDAIFENIPDMIFVKDAETLAFTRFNRAGEELLGVVRADLLGKTDHDLFSPSEAAHFQAKDRETLAAGALVEITEESIQTARGPRWLLTKKVPILGEDGRPRYLLGISHDITEAKRHEQALVAEKEKTELVNRELEAFSYSVAHDLRAPLRSIDGFSLAMAEDYGDRMDDEGRRYLRRIRENAQRMAALIDDLLALSRVSRQPLVPQRIDLGALAGATLARLQRDEPGRHVEIAIEPNLGASGDPRLLGIAFDNLLGNAWKFTSKTAAAKIEVGRTATAQGPAFFVRDNGAGFEPQYTDRLFRVFQRLHSDTEYPGTGIGLATVARIIARHRGRVWAEGAPGQGATFYFTLEEPDAL